MSTLSRWVSPLDHRGMAVWGSIACLYLSYELSRVQGELSEVWPNRCHRIKERLSHGEDNAHLDVTFNDKVVNKKPSPQDLKDAQLWSIDSSKQVTTVSPNITPWLIPIRDYKGARVRLNRLTPMWVELYSDSLPSVMLIYENDQEMSQLYQYLVEGSHHEISETSDLERSQILSRIALEERAYQVQPKDLTCERRRIKIEFPQVLSLLLKSAESGVTRAYRWMDGLWELKSELRGHHRRTIRRRISKDASTQSLWSISWAQTQSSEQVNVLSSESSPPPWLTTLLAALDQAQGSPGKARSLIEALPSQVILLDQEQK